MRAMLLRVIVEPPQIFWAPILPAMGNIILNTSLMILCLSIHLINPLPFFITMAIGHGFIAGYTVRDPHLSNLIAAWMETRRQTTNLVAAKGNKYVA